MRPDVSEQGKTVLRIPTMTIQMLSVKELDNMLKSNSNCRTKENKR